MSLLMKIVTILTGIALFLSPMYISIRGSEAVCGTSLETAARVAQDDHEGQAGQGPGHRGKPPGAEGEGARRQDGGGETQQRAAGDGHGSEPPGAR